VKRILALMLALLVLLTGTAFASKSNLANDLGDFSAYGDGNLEKYEEPITLTFLTTDQKSTEVQYNADDPARKSAHENAWITAYKDYLNIEIKREIAEDSTALNARLNTGMATEEHGLYVDKFLAEKDKYSSFMGGNNPLYIIENPDAETDKKLLVVRDSYTDALAPFLSQNYSEIHLLDLRYYRTPVAAYAEAMGADEIFVLYSVDNFQKDADVIFLGQ